jgi:hypothetical protein
VNVTGMVDWLRRESFVIGREIAGSIPNEYSKNNHIEKMKDSNYSQMYKQNKKIYQINHKNDVKQKKTYKINGK